MLFDWSEWHRSTWELKSISSITSADNQVRSGIKQISAAKGELVLDITKSSASDQQINDAIFNRLKRSAEAGLDIMII